MGFRQKILLSFLIIFLIFAICIYPIVHGLIGWIQEKNFKNRTLQLVQNLRLAPNLDSLIQQVEELEKFLFFRISLFDPRVGYIYDSHEATAGFSHEQLITQSGLDKVIKKKINYEVHFSPLFRQEIAYVAVQFNYQDKDYILQTAFPYEEIFRMIHDLTLTIFILGIVVLLSFSILSWFMIHLLTHPVEEIIQAIQPYQRGEIQQIPEIKIKRGIHWGDEFRKLAETFNSLSRHIDHQISSLVLEKNEKNAILESLLEGVIAVDEKMKIIYMNRMTEVFLGINERELVGQNFSFAHQKSCEDLIKEAQKTRQTLVLMIKPKGKQKRYLDAVAVPRIKGGAILVLQDKTSLHKVIELGRDFIANASHELKTPITIIRGFAETLHDHPELTREMYHEITDKIVTNCKRMDTLVKNLLTLAAVDEKLPDSRLQNCNLYHLMEQAKQTMLSIHPEAKILIKTKGEGPFDLMADNDLFFQAILNLLDNGIKYSKKEKEVTIHIEKYSKKFIIRVSDKGIGIPAEELERIFERFYAVDKRESRSLGGSGLGLSIVEPIIEKHRGKIEVESKIGQGTTFIITLPISKKVNV
ncbi:MAG: ATP-binding protein [Chlamydiales bacterium]